MSPIASFRADRSVVRQYDACMRRVAKCREKAHENPRKRQFFLEWARYYKGEARRLLVDYR